jgi:hypothetical protein
LIIGDAAVGVDHGRQIVTVDDLESGVSLAGQQVVRVKAANPTICPRSFMPLG